MILIAYSGGVDSTVLLHQLAQAHPPEQLRAIHINHALYPEADTWQLHCEQYCHFLNIEFICVKLQDKPPVGESIEAWARTQRLAIFEQHLKQDEILMTAHHADDQAETILFQLIRGAGPKGLSAMGAEKSLGQGTWVRPFLNVSKAEILAYAQLHELSWITDHSNEDTQFDRNFLRKRILPLLKERWPSVDQTLTRSARHCAEQEALLESLLTPLYLAALGSKPGTLSIKALLQYEPRIQRALIRYWLRGKNYPMPGHKKFEKIFEDLIPARPDAQPQIVWGEVCLRRYRDDLYALSLNEPQPKIKGTKKFFQAEGIPPWEREK